MKKYLFGVIAIALAISISSFTISKEAHQGSKSDPLYWYRVDAATNTILTSGSFYILDEKEDVSSPCASGSSNDCLRGFVSQPTSFPETALGTDQIKKP